MNIIFFGDSLTEGIPGISYLDILREKLPHHTLVNAGKGGDTVISLHKRIKKMNLNKNYDIAFLWVGTNDILVHISKKNPIIKMCCMQPWAKNINDFSDRYQKLLKMISKNAKKIFVVSPAIIGEDVNNRWNKKLGELSLEIKKISSKFKNVDYIDMHKEFTSFLSTKKPSKFILDGIFRDVIAAWLFNIPERVEKKSRERGLYLTLDGAHLNAAGAQMVSNIFLECIKNEMRRGN